MFGKKIRPPALEKAEDYFPYIGHRLDQYPDPLHLRDNIMGYKKFHAPADTKEFQLENSAYDKIHLDIHPDNFRVANDPNSVNILVPRHRSLFDFTAFQPIHHDMVNQKIMILAGHNLFVHHLNKYLRGYGGFVFLRDDAELELDFEKKPRVFLDKDVYFKDVLPGYLKQEVFCKGPDKHDLMVYLEYEKDARTGRNNGGRSKTGELRQINWALIKLFYDLGMQQGVNVYVTPVNVGFSKIPDAPYTVNPPTSGKAMKSLRYFFEQRFVYEQYAKYATTHPDARMTGFNRYGKPELLNTMDFSSLRAFKRYADDLRTKIGELETVFPLYLICKAMEQQDTVNLKSLSDRMYHIHERLKKKNVKFFDVEDSRGNLLKTEELAEKAVNHINANPVYHMGHVKGKKLMRIRKNYLYSSELKLQLWYANNILHFDKDAADTYL